MFKEEDFAIFFIGNFNNTSNKKITGDIIAVRSTGI